MFYRCAMQPAVNLLIPAVALNRQMCREYISVLIISCVIAAGYTQRCQQTSRWLLCQQHIRNYLLSTSLVTCEVQYLFDWMQMTRHFLV